MGLPIPTLPTSPMNSGLFIELGTASATIPASKWPGGMGCGKLLAVAKNISGLCIESFGIYII